jgi:hypothetical protein
VLEYSFATQKLLPLYLQGTHDMMNWMPPPTNYGGFWLDAIKVGCRGHDEHVKPGQIEDDM